MSAVKRFRIATEHRIGQLQILEANEKRLKYELAAWASRFAGQKAKNMAWWYYLAQIDATGAALRLVREAIGGAR